MDGGNSSTRTPTSSAIVSRSAESVSASGRPAVTANTTRPLLTANVAAANAAALPVRDE